jgi:hypothetical protein
MNQVVSFIKLFIGLKLKREKKRERGKRNALYALY